MGDTVAGPVGNPAHGGEERTTGKKGYADRIGGPVKTRVTNIAATPGPRRSR